MASSDLAVIVLAAGKGTRMKSAIPKVLHPLAGRAMVQRVTDAARALCDQVLVVTSPDGDAVRQALADDGVQFVVQQRQLGTGDAVAAALPALDPATRQVLVLCGDTPLLQPELLSRLCDQTPAEGMGIITARFDDPTGLGRILRDDQNAVTGIVEERDASDVQRRIREINTGIYLLPCGRLADWLGRLEAGNAQGELYLTDVVASAVAEDLPVATVDCEDLLQVTGINDRVQLAALERAWQARQAEGLMRAGVTLQDPYRIDIRGTLEAGQDTTIDVNCVFAGAVILGRGVRIGANVVLEDVQIGDGVTIEPFTHIRGASIEQGATIGPFARLREGTRLGADTRIGNFVEVKKTTLGAGSKANHLAYLGDATIGAGCNVGAGTITCNYDGVGKHPTVLGDGVFIGSNSTLVAPLTVGDGGYVAAGSTITSAIPDGNLGVGRARQRNIDKWKSPKQRQQGQE